MVDKGVSKSFWNVLQIFLAHLINNQLYFSGLLEKSGLKVNYFLSV